MTMPDERTRALIWAGGFLIELARDETLPLAIRQRAVKIARHFPTVEQVSSTAAFRHSPAPDEILKSPSGLQAWAQDCVFGPLRRSTQLEWPDELKEPRD
jgi:hypothetical protein